MTLKADAAGFELVAKLVEVINLAVEDDPVAGGRILHGLMPERRKIKNRQPLVPKADLQRLGLRIFEQHYCQQHRSGIVGPAVRERARGSFQNSSRDLGVTRQDTNDAA